MAFLCLVLTSCSKDNSINDQQDKYEIDLELVKKNNSELSSRILEIINIHRDSLGLNTLQLDNQYSSALAVDHSLYMIDVNELNHDNFGYRSDAIKYYQKAKTVSEIVGYGYDTAEGVVNAWLNSESHKVIIEGDFTHTGFGVLKSDNNRNYFTQMFYKK
ncbi:CAP domain-containing protein [Aequorivita sp. KMM 9714]|uniref:CAP domain-containing protein n=1 Tax=Aequorivita sp. KMM 9714 TaxID=2707173 RepID=UPI0013EDE61D|nr:CAP domain-containing protein [Aequorivita sp. KMM 9714]NGX82837.1 CAP domain-containing protein [Aequorivita sp. KMM 9714]